MQNKIKEKIKKGEQVIGTFHEMGSAAVAECLALSALDYFIIDAEHGPFDVESAMLAILAAERHGSVPFVRVKECARSPILKMLDIGAMGLIVPFIQSLEQAKQAVGFAKYPPLGQRGYAHARVSGFGTAAYAQNVQGHCQTANEEALLILQCETIGCLREIDKIAALPGVDGIFVGPYDLSIAMGMPGDFDAPAFQEAVACILRACKTHNKQSYIFAGTVEAARARLEQGFDAIAFGIDPQLLIQSINGMVGAIKGEA